VSALRTEERFKGIFGDASELKRTTRLVDNEGANEMDAGEFTNGFIWTKRRNSE